MDSSERLDNLLTDYVQQGYMVQSFDSQTHDSGGLHFSSEVQEIKVYMKNKSGKKLCLQLISKRLPEKEKHVILNSQLGFLKEASFYNDCIPEYSKIQRDHNLDAQNIFSKCYFASDREILLDDLRQFNFVTCKERLNKLQTVLVIQELAKFHSTGIALKFSKPDIFKTKLATVITPALQNEANPNKEYINKEFRREITELLKSMDGLGTFADSVDSLLSEIDESKLPTPREPYATLLHNDLWNGNILFKYSSSNEPIEVKFVDFQTMIYNSPARDLVYFLLTSVNAEVLKEFEDLVGLYNYEFIHNLSKLGVSVEKFTFNELLEEIDVYGPTKLKHMIKLFKTRYCNEMNETNFKFELQQLITMFKERNWFY